MAPANHLPTRRLAEAYLQANPTPAPAQLQAFLAQQPRPLPAPATALPRRLVLLMGTLLAFVLVVIVAFTLFFLFGEDRTRQVQRPALTARQRAQAFRL